jgi:hypothetical protein
MAISKEFLSGGHLAGSRSGTDQNVCSKSTSVIERPFECQEVSGRAIRGALVRRQARR